MKILIPFFIACITLCTAHTLCGQNIQGQAIIQLKKGIALEDYLTDANTKNRGQQFAMLKTICKKRNVYLISYQGGDVDKLPIQVTDHPYVAMAQPNAYVQYRDVTPNDPNYDQQWYLDKIRAPEAWEIATGGVTINGDTIVVALLDEGFDLTHSDLKNRIWRNPGEIGNDNIDNDGNGFVNDTLGWNFDSFNPSHFNEIHGTMVIGVIGAEGNNDNYVSGVNWDVDIFVNTNRSGELANIIAGYYYFTDMRRLYDTSNGEKGAYIVVNNVSYGIDEFFCDLISCMVSSI